MKHILFFLLVSLVSLPSFAQVQKYNCQAEAYNSVMEAKTNLEECTVSFNQRAFNKLLVKITADKKKGDYTTNLLKALKRVDQVYYVSSSSCIKEHRSDLREMKKDIMELLLGCQKF
ncbi:MAG TPA: hypothetical protein VNJ01_11295 [Bacteriovoracaceae bacterium]|nr:hypothetical protein [Bacteriovoracaceae bacterium]